MFVRRTLVSGASVLPLTKPALTKKRSTLACLPSSSSQRPKTKRLATTTANDEDEEEQALGWKPMVTHTPSASTVVRLKQQQQQQQQLDEKTVPVLPVAPRRPVSPRPSSQTKHLLDQTRVRRELELLTDAWVVFTDGACRKNPGPAGSAAVLVNKGKEKFERTQSFDRATNNIAELTGLLLGLQLLREAHKRQAKTKWVLYTDSQYAKNVVEGTWKAKANLELIQQVRASIAAAKKDYPVSISLRWCPAHCGLEWNERADKLASASASACSTSSE
jgi:ribonuclease HI